MNALNLHQDVALLTADVINIYSVSDAETPLADAVEAALVDLGELLIHRDGDTVVARTDLGLGERVILAGHLDTVPLPTTEGSRGTVPGTWDEVPGQGILHGRGAVDMKGGVAVQLALAAAIGRGDLVPNRDVTFIFYDHEEVEAYKSGLGRLVAHAPALAHGDFAILLEPTNGAVEGGCNGTSRFEVTTTGEAAHAARAWMGSNAIHKAAPILSRLAEYEPATIHVDGLDYRESLNAVRINGGTAGNVIPDECVVEINYRFAPDKTPEQAEAHVRELLAGFEVVRTDAAPGARPGLNHPAAASFLAAVGAEAKPKYGWTDVARFSALGIPAVNFGPGDALLAHKDNEHVHADAIRRCYTSLRTWLTGEVADQAAGEAEGQ